MTARRGDRGMVTVELAIGLLTAGVMTVLAVWVVNLVVIQTQCADVAAQVARHLGRGDAAAAAQARHRAPEGSRVHTTRGGGVVAVQVAVDESLGRLGPVHLQGQAVADLEPGQQ